MKYAVGSESHSVLGFIRLEVDVRSALVNGVEQHFVYESDCWGVMFDVFSDVFLRDCLVTCHGLGAILCGHG